MLAGPSTALPRDLNVANNRSLQRRRLSAAAVVLTVAAGALTVGTVIAPVAQAAQPKPGHTTLVPEVPRNNTPRISNGEIWDIEVVGKPGLHRGGFTSLAEHDRQHHDRQPALPRRPSTSTGLIDTTFRPTFNGGVSAVEASPDGTKLFVGGTFNTVNGVARQKVASLNLTTGAPLTSVRVHAEHQQPGHGARGHQLHGLHRWQVLPYQRCR